MRKIVIMMSLFVALVVFAGYGNTSNSQKSDSLRSDKPAEVQNDTGKTKHEQAINSKGKILVAYFSHSGNTRLIANQIHGLVGGDIFEIKTIKQYNKDFETTVDEARKELDTNARPELAAKIKNMKDYEVIFIGFPNWCGTMPMALFTFLEQYDFKDKTIVPFCTHGTSGLSNTITDLNKLVPQANVREVLGIYRNNVRNADDTVKIWLHNLGYIN